MEITWVLLQQPERRVEALPPSMPSGSSLAFQPVKCSLRTSRLPRGRRDGRGEPGDHCSPEAHPWPTCLEPLEEWPGGQG